MADLTQATQATATIELAGNTYQLSPLTFFDLANVVQRLRDEIVVRATKAMRYASSTEDRETMMKVAFDKAQAIKFLDRDSVSEPVQDYIASAEGAAYLLYLSLHKTLKSVTMDDISEMGEDATGFKVAIARIMAISGFTEESDVTASGTKSGEAGTPVSGE